METDKYEELGDLDTIQSKFGIRTSNTRYREISELNEEN